MPYEILKSIQPREYQKRIFETCKKKNCLVVLPTGVGKTLIALMLVIDRQKKFPASKALFLAPTRPLAEQHLNYFKKHLPELFAEMTLFTGKVSPEKRKKLWQTSDIIFSTPQCIANDLKNNLYNLEDVSLLIEDEAHRCLKNHSYVYVAKKYKEQAKNPLILGLTASPGADKSTIKQIAENLGIEEIEIRTRESEDVKPYLQSLKFEIIKLDFPTEFQELKKHLKDIYDKKIEELQNRKLLLSPPTKKNLLDVQKRLINMISTGNRNFNILAGATACAQALKILHAIELLETQTLFSLQKYMQELFEQANKSKTRAVKQLIKNLSFNKAYIKLNELLAKRIENPKLAKVKEIIKSEFQRSPKTKAIIFSQYRNTILTITKTINEIPQVNARVFVGQQKKGETGLTQKEQQELIEQFKNGTINVIVSSSIGEEGLDIPEVSTVIFYEPIPSAIRQIQRKGRTARLQPGKLIILMIKKTLDESYYWSAFHKERKMYRILKNIKEELATKKQRSQKTLFDVTNDSKN